MKATEEEYKQALENAIRHVNRTNQNVRCPMCRAIVLIPNYSMHIAHDSHHKCSDYICRHIFKVKDAKLYY